MVRKIMTLVALLLLAACARYPMDQKTFSPDRIQHITEFRQSGNPSDVAGRVAYVEPGDVIPVKLKVDSEWLEISQREIELVAKRRIYCRVSLPENMTRERLDRLMNLDDRSFSAMTAAQKAALFDGVMLYLSKDAVHWAALNDRQGLKDVFGIEMGTLSAGMGMNATEGLWLALGLKLEASGK